MEMTLNVMLDDGAFMPQRAHATDAGMDLRTPRTFTIQPYSSAVVDTGVHVEIPKYFAGVLISKSGLNVNRDITSTGLIDTGYTGSIRVKLYNHGDKERRFSAGDKISQLMIVPCVLCGVQQVDGFADTERGDNGFGSTGR